MSAILSNVKSSVASVFEIHYRFNGIKRWDVVHANSEDDALEELIKKHNSNLMDIDAVFEYKLKSFKFFD